MTKIIRFHNLAETYAGEKCFITEIMNAEAFSSFSLAEARVAPVVTTVAHTLTETDEVYYILTGKGEMEVGGEIIGTVAEKDIVFIPRNTSQRIKNILDQDLIFLCICSPRFELKL